MSPGGAGVGVLPPGSAGVAAGLGGSAAGGFSTGGGLDSVGLCGSGPSAGPGAGLPDGPGLPGGPGSGGLGAAGGGSAGGLADGTFGISGGFFKPFSTSAARLPALPTLESGPPGKAKVATSKIDFPSASAGFVLHSSQ